MIPFNKPYSTGKELDYIQASIQSGRIAGNGPFTKKCHDFFEEQFGFEKVLLTTSCTDALELAAILLDIQPGDEVIMPSFTFVSTANAFLLRGAKVIFVDSRPDHPGMDENKIEQAITKKTKAIVAMHYAGVACDMYKITSIAKKHGLFVVEDAAQAIDGFYKNKRLGSFGHLSAFSFHETKNIISGEGGMLVINDRRFVERAEIVRENGTDRAQFLRGKIEKYGWMDIGSSFMPSDISAAFLFAQLEKTKEIQRKRKQIWGKYEQAFKKLLEPAGKAKLHFVPKYAGHNAHMYYLVCSNGTEREQLIAHLKKDGVQAVFHYLPLHNSKFYSKSYEGEQLQNAERYSQCLVRLPFFYELTEPEQNKIIDSVLAFYKS